MDRQKEERERGVTISCTTKEFFTDKWHYTIIDAPGELCFSHCCWFSALFWIGCFSVRRRVLSSSSLGARKNSRTLH